MEEKRHRIIISTSIIGILTNLALAIFKAIVGVLANSIAILLDAINNFSDMVSSIVTIAGTHVARLSPDREHPMGHGRSEYLSAVMVAIIIIYIGFTALIESVRKIISPEVPNYSTLTIFVVAVAVVVKVVLGLYVYRVGRKVDSDSLAGSGKDALFDAMISLTTLIAAIVFICTGFSVEAYLAAAISVFITYSGYRMLRGTFSVIIGERADPRLSRKIRTEIEKVDGVKGVYDLAIHDYGPNRLFASINVEFPEKMTASQIDDASRAIRHLIYRKCGVVVSSVGVYAVDGSEKAAKLRREIEKGISKFEYVGQIHGFHIDEAKKKISFGLVVSADVEDSDAYRRAVRESLMKDILDYDFAITLDPDFGN